MRKSILKTFAVASVVFAAILFIAPTQIEASHFWDGCTLGFWKNHTGWWPVDVEVKSLDSSDTRIFPPLAPNTPLCDIFMNASMYDLCFDDKGDPITLLDALNFPGGDEEVGAARIFLRQAVATLLNLVHPDVSFIGERKGVHDPVLHIIDPVNRLLSFYDREVMLDQALKYDSWNNWYCPLGGNKFEQGDKVKKKKVAKKKKNK